MKLSDTFAKSLMYRLGSSIKNKHVSAFVRYGSIAKMWNLVCVEVATNGNYSPKLNAQILESGLDNIVFAIDGTSQEVYEQYRVNGKLKLVTRNVRELVELRNQVGQTRPYIEIQFLVFQHNRHEIESIRRLARDCRADGLLVRAAVAPGNKENRRRYYTWNEERNFCRRFWYTASINADMGVTPCCNFFFKRDDLGNLSGRPLGRHPDNGRRLKRRNTRCRDGAGRRRRDSSLALSAAWQESVLRFCCRADGRGDSRFQNRIRVTKRAWAAIFYNVTHLWRCRRFLVLLQLISHKVLRFLLMIPLFVAFLCSVALARTSPGWAAFALVQASLYGLSALAVASASRGIHLPGIGFLGFLLLNVVAFADGSFRFFFGNRASAWRDSAAVLGGSPTVDELQKTSLR